MALVAGVRMMEAVDFAGVSKPSVSFGRTRVGSKKYSTLALPVTCLWCSIWVQLV